MGYLAVQLAKWGGARVLATCSGRDMGRVKTAGGGRGVFLRQRDLGRGHHGGHRGAGCGPGRRVGVRCECRLLAEVMKPLGTIAIYGSGKDMTPVLPFGPIMFKALNMGFHADLHPAGRGAGRAISRLHTALTKARWCCRSRTSTRPMKRPQRMRRSRPAGALARCWSSSSRAECGAQGCVGRAPMRDRTRSGNGC